METNESTQPTSENQVLHFDAENATCWVYTFKEGLLSAIAHDLKLRVEDFRIVVDLRQHSVHATFATDSLRVECARRGNVDDRTTLRAKDMLEIEKRTRTEVLHSARFPEARFTATLDPDSRPVDAEGATRVVTGMLTLHGRTGPATATAVFRDGSWRAQAQIHQPDFGIRPYRAALGGLRVQAGIAVEVILPHRQDGSGPRGPSRP
ncbi:MAG: YceI family protein [Myxococcota bacterium]